MSTEQILITAIGSVTSALVYVSALLWKRSEQCEADRQRLSADIQLLREQKGQAVGRLEAVDNCPAVQCPFRENEPPRGRITGPIVAGLIGGLIVLGLCGCSSYQVAGKITTPYGSIASAGKTIPLEARAGFEK